jgi:3-oxoacyl-[acyl-carrier protein] reductase
MSRTYGMDLGIAGRKAIVCGGNAGLGLACATALAQAGVDLVLVARTEEKLQRVAQTLHDDTGVDVRTVAVDLTAPEALQRIRAACADPDILINNGGGPPPGDFRDWGRAEWVAALDGSMIAPIQLIRAYVDGMIERRWGRILNIASYSAKLPLPLLGLSNGARAGLIGFASGLAREVAEHGVTINNLLPGNFHTERLERYAAAVGARTDRTPLEVLQEMARNTPVRRIGRPEEFGAWCAFLASEHGGYVTAQNFLLDGGTYPGVY